ncbi:hypothetical protein LENED_005583 [Lentinula edodes]|uniref:CxC2-like cysteine cluster KDZ transposase-associated domain-containing protein n=1 Tax=Lentinula edodes TaxID=5353 RepID=A0A1Q3E9H7_LENED|nr:hypothetical protein LENED_005583 [Lentinula edodes]
MPRPRKLPDGSHSTVYRPPPVNSQNHRVINHRYTETGAGRSTTVSIPLALKTPDIPGIPEDLVNTLIEMPPEDENMSYAGGGSIGSDASTSFTYDFAKSLMATQNGDEEALDSEPLKRVQNYLAEWRPEIPRYLKEILRHEGLESVRSREVLRMIREWRHLRMLKHAGVGYKGVDQDVPGILAVKCAACPHPGINIPGDWASNREKIWLYKVFFALDANFRLTRFNVSSEARDPGFNKGRAYFVDDPTLQYHLASFAGRWPAEKSDCSDHDAIKLANRRGDHNLSTTGLALATCARHDTIHANSGVDLRLGEEYLLMDYSLLSAIQSFPNLPVTASYDIMCQFSKKLYARIGSYPDMLKTPTPFPRYQLLVPKFHLAAHKESCVWSFSYNYAPGVGRTDGEGVERNWAITNSLSGSTKKMGPGSRRDTLDDHFGDFNWRKMISLASHLHSKAVEAATVREEMVRAFHAASEGLQESTKKQWRQMVLAWEADPDKRMPNAYEHTIRKYTMNRTRLELAKEDADLIGNDTAAQAVSARISRNQLICQGLELEEQLRRLKFDMKTVTEGSTDLALHMPITVILRQQLASSGQTHFVYDLPLLLPSQVFRLGSSCDLVLLDFEWRLRYAAAHDALEQMRKHLLERNWSIDWKRRYGHGVRDGTRSANDVSKLTDKVEACAARYRIHYAVLSTLAEKLGKVGWSADLRELRDSDIRAISRGNEETLRLGEGYVVTSWIWNTSGIDKTDDLSLAECLRVSWCKARARALRWQEECVLLQEEMRRVRAFLEHEVNKWKLRASEASGDPGASAYAHRQASIHGNIKDFCIEKWTGLDAMLAGGLGGISLHGEQLFVN